MYVGFLPQCLKENRILQIKILYQDKQKTLGRNRKAVFLLLKSPCK